MTTVHAEIIGDKALLTRTDLERLVAIAQRSEEIDLRIDEDDLPAESIMRLAEQGGAFDWLTEEEDLYTVDDLKARFK